MPRRVGIAALLGALALPAAADAAPGMLSIEGTFSYVEVRDADGDVVVRRRPARRHVRMLRHLPEGVYRVRANRTRATRCSRRVHVFSSGLTEVHVSGRPGRRCTMSRRALHARFPARSHIRAVRTYLRTRGGVNSWSLVDSWGRVHGFAPQRVYVSASLVKAMLLVAYLRGIGNRMPDAGERGSLGPMITESSNDAADTIYYRVGDAGLYAVAKLGHMAQFSVAGYWANAYVSAEDQARLFNRIDRLVPKRSRGYARGLLAGIVPYQRWGFSRYAGAAGFKTFFKGGWRETGAGQLVHEAALFERGDTRFSMAVLTDGNPSHEHGTETLRGVAQLVFRRRGRGSRGRDRQGRHARHAPRRPGGRPPPCARDQGRPRLPDEGQPHLSPPSRLTYIASRSRHNTGSAVDLMLTNAMERFGFAAYRREWWHFEHHIRLDRYLDLTLGCARHN